MECLKNYTFRCASSNAIRMTSIRSGEDEQDSVGRHELTRWSWHLLVFCNHRYYCIRTQGTWNQRSFELVQTARQISHKLLVVAQLETTWVCVVSELGVGRNTQVRRNYTTPHKTQMIQQSTYWLTGRNAQISPALP